MMWKGEGDNEVDMRYTDLGVDETRDVCPQAGKRDRWSSEVQSLELVKPRTVQPPLP